MFQSLLQQKFKRFFQEWRKKRIQKFGPVGCLIDGYRDISRSDFWEWNENILGPLTFDKDRTLTFDGNNFMVRYEGHPDVDEVVKSHSIPLEKWLSEHAKNRDPSLVIDKKWKYRTLWHEFLIVTQVNNKIV